MWNCEVCGAGTPETCKCIKLPPQDLAHQLTYAELLQQAVEPANEAVHVLAARAEKYEQALREIEKVPNVEETPDFDVMVDQMLEIAAKALRSS